MSRKPPAKSGRKAMLADPILSKSILAAVVRAYRTDATVLEAAHAAGVSDRVLYRWRERGRVAFEACEGVLARCPPEDRPFLQLYVKTTQARAQRRLERREAIERAGMELRPNGEVVVRDWRALAWLEERSDRQALLSGEQVSDPEPTDAEIEELIHETVDELGLEVRRTTRTTRRRRRSSA